MQFSQPTTARHINRLRILDAIVHHEGISRADLSRTTGLNKVSTSEIVDQLLEEGIVGETGKKESSYGRKPIGLELIKDRYVIVAVEVNRRAISIAMVNLHGEIRRFERLPIEAHPSAEYVCAHIITLANKITSRFANTDIIKGMAVSFEGKIEIATGTVLESSLWNWKSVPLGYALSKHLSFPILIENSMRALIVGEKWFGNLSTKDSLFYVDWGEHIHAALISKGKMLSEEESLFGHLPIRNTSLCRCGSIGCLETVSSGWALLEQYGHNCTLKQFCHIPYTDEKAHQLKSQAAHALGEALIPVATLLRPHSILIGGALSPLCDTYLPLIEKSFAEKASEVIRTTTKIEKTALKESGILGIAAVALDDFIFRRTLLERLSHQRL